MASIRRDLDLTTIGRLMSRGDILRVLRNRLFVVDALKRTPSILEERIASPVFIVGQGRSGTTVLFELLDQDPDNRAPRGWEAATPVAPPEETLADGITRGKFGAHSYAAADYGLSAAQIREDLRFYTDHFGVALED
ncbi:MAG: sulfotransferase [Candidatus Binatia bacterium]